jgi:DtxR family Mn-dependent transcriptional regulator
MLSAVREDYLKAIYRLQEEHEGRVQTSQIAGHLEITESSVSTMVKKLAEKDLIEHQAYKGVALTDTGRSVALEVIRHHRLLEAFLSETLDYDWSEVHEEADRLEHHISETFARRIAQALDHPSTDPHGDPIPDEGLETADVAPSFPLSDAGEGETVTVSRVNDRDPEILRYLGDQGLTPGAQVEIVEVAPFGMVTITLDGGEHVSLPEDVAGHVRVRSRS